ncbi:MAG TPA: cupin domain-containing protein [Kofleriaceae bacterium]|nr:cupin domain-containing protein [Kofleriaceae bacterium]
MVDTLVCQDLDRAIALFTHLGLRLDTIFPADDPAVASLSGRDTAVRLVRADAGALAELSALDELPATRSSYVVVDGNDSTWKVGRAGMQYRDLIPDRQGGRYIASHIQIPAGGPVPDYVHFHAIEFQLIYCYRGWVRVVYEEQGEPFVMHAGECVLQPPGIRHRVLEASPGLEVIEIGSPAVHATHVDHERTLPTATRDAERDFGGQRFVYFQPQAGTPVASRIAGFEATELGIVGATGGVASVRVLRVRDPDSVARGPAYRHDADLLFHFVLRGQLTLDGAHRLGATASFVIPAGQPFLWREASADLELLQVALPGVFAIDKI